ncbi:MAG: YkgJ family cysteine cluster protein [Bacilli bacterium]|nr:YkgJ family cysteine cluster protein [Bacilli bacterium]
MKKEIGTYKDCSNCKNKNNNCCTDFVNIDNPLITEKELEIIKLRSNNKEFYKKITPHLYNIKTCENGVCPFYKKGCSIYLYRPVDCRLYPFDIIRKKDKYYLILYKYPCNNVEVTKKFIDDNINDVELLANNLAEFIEEYTCHICNQKLQKKEYIVIKELITK